MASEDGSIQFSGKLELVLQWDLDHHEATLHIDGKSLAYALLEKLMPGFNENKSIGEQLGDFRISFERMGKVAPQQPHRRHEVAIRIGADSWLDVCQALNHLLFLYETEGEGHNLTSGGPSYGMIALDERDDSVTHASYFQEVDEWLAARRGGAPAVER